MNHWIQLLPPALPSCSTIRLIRCALIKLGMAGAGLLHASTSGRAVHPPTAGLHFSRPLGAALAACLLFSSPAHATMGTAFEGIADVRDADTLKVCYAEIQAQQSSPLLSGDTA